MSAVEAAETASQDENKPSESVNMSAVLGNAPDDQQLNMTVDLMNVSKTFHDEAEKQHKYPYSYTSHLSSRMRHSGSITSSSTSPLKNTLNNTQNINNQERPRSITKDEQFIQN